MRHFQSSRFAALTLFLSIMVAGPAQAYGQSPGSPPPRTSSALKRTVWTLIGAGIGFGAGLMFGVNRFDDAINSDRKVWTSALVGAAAGGVAGATLSRNVKPSLDGRPQADRLWNGMAVGAAAGAAIGMVIIPARECTPVNPECPTILRIGVGIPATALGAALGAAIDRLHR